MLVATFAAACTGSDQAETRAEPASWIPPSPPDGEAAYQPMTKTRLHVLRNEHPRTLYWLGWSFDGLQLRSGGKSGFIYGDCDPTPCAPPLDVQTWALAKRHPRKFSSEFDCAQTRVQGVPAAAFEGVEALEVYSGEQTVVIFSHSPELTLRAADALRTLAGGALRPAPAHVRRTLGRRCDNRRSVADLLQAGA